jgi:putative molybdopterin biosynthesis protein
LLVSQAGRGTRVAGNIPVLKGKTQETLRHLNLVNRSESFLLESITAGYSIEEVQQALDLAMDRWRSVQGTGTKAESSVIRFAGSHDLVVNDLAHSYFGKIEKKALFHLAYMGSLGGLIALAENKAEIAGCHLWDLEAGEYNLPFIKRLLPGRKALVVTLAHRRQGLIVHPDNPLGINALTDLTRREVRFINRQAGSGTRVWLDVMLKELGLSTEDINGYEREGLTHSEVARAVADGSADTGLGLEAAARSFGLDFIFLNRERYDLVLMEETATLPPVQRLINWLSSPDGRQFVAAHPGYEAESTGKTYSL